MDSKRKSWISRVGIVGVAAVLVGILSVVQYQRMQRMMSEEMDMRGRVILSAMAREIEHTLLLTETTLKENLWEVRRSMVHPDSVFAAMCRLIDDNPNAVGGCLAFVPDYYPSKGRLFEPYASKVDGKIFVSQIAGPEHDYSQNPEFLWVLDNQVPTWTDPYRYGPDSLSLATYSYPVRDGEGRLAAVCGLDIDLSWLGDTLNAIQPYPSSFALLLTGDGKLVAGPPECRVSAKDVAQVVAFMDGEASVPANSDYFLQTIVLDKDPNWQLLQVNRKDEVFVRMRRMRLQQTVFILLALAILAFMLNRYARSQGKLLQASEERARIGSELRIAAGIQQSMLPRGHLSRADIEVCGSLVPAREVGGDIYDYFLRDEKLFFCIGDVSGKGVPAAMLMGVVHALFRSASAHESQPDRIMRDINAMVCQQNDENMFVTLFIGVLDLSSGRLRYCDAGHDCPVILEGGALRIEPCKPHLPVGVFEDVGYGMQETQIAPGSLLFLYTDGLTEARDVQGEFFGLQRVRDVLGRCAENQPAPGEVLEAVGGAVRQFAGDAEQSDDLTLLAVRYTLK